MRKGGSNKLYTPEFKQHVIETMQKKGLSCQEAERQFDITKDRVRRWERIYLTEGPEGLAVRRRGRGSTGRPAQFPKAAEEDLLAEVQRLRVENAYLKNLQAL